MLAGTRPEFQAAAESRAAGQSTPGSYRVSVLGVRGARAAETTTEVLAFLEQYRRAVEARDVDAVAALYLGFSSGQRTALERYFRNVRDLRVQVDRVEAAIVGEEGVVSYTRIDDFTDVPTEAPQHVSVRLTNTLRRVGGQWRFSGGP